MQQTIEIESLGEQIVKAAKLAAVIHMEQEREAARNESEENDQHTHLRPCIASRN